MERSTSSGLESGNRETGRLKQVLALGLTGALVEGCAPGIQPAQVRGAVKACLVDADFVSDSVNSARQGLAAETEDGCDQALLELEIAGDFTKGMQDCFGKIQQSIKPDSSFLDNTSVLGDGMAEARQKVLGLGWKDLRRQIRRQCYGPMKASRPVDGATAEGNKQ